MALFKIKKGVKANLPTSYVEGYCYFTTDDGKFYIDTSNAADGRICLNAGAADIATKATQDASGNVITSTYATKIELNDVSSLVGSIPVSTQITSAINDAGFLTVDLNSADSGTEPYINADMLGGILANQYALKSDIIAEGASSVTSINGKIGDVSLTYSDVGAAATNHTHDYVPISRTINNKALSGNISLTYSDVGAAAENHTHDYVPTNRTINGKALSDNISLTYSDVGAAAASHTHNYASSSHTHTSLQSLGNVSPETGRTANRGGVYAYGTTSGVSGGPTTYTAMIGFGQGAGGSGEISVGWTSGMGMWYRALRDYEDSWYDWVKVYDNKNLKFSLSGTTLTITTS